jgi:hypothetical protein
MKKISIFFALFCFLASATFAQDDTTTARKENKNKSLLGYFMVHESAPVKYSYENGMVIDNQTNQMQPAKTLEFDIQHRFGSMENGISDLFGIYGAANTRLGLSYTITDWLQVGYGISKQNMISDFALKANLLQQTKDNKVPLSVTYYGNMSIDGTEDVNFGKNYKFADRFAYFNELLVTRKFASWFTFSFGGSFTHFNKVDSLMEHDKVALHFVTRFKISPQSSIVLNYDLPLKLSGIKEWEEIKDPPKSNLGVGWEIATNTHTFQIFVGTSTYLVPQYNNMLNQNDWTNGDIFVGFNITRIWNF